MVARFGAFLQGRYSRVVECWRYDVAAARRRQSVSRRATDVERAVDLARDYEISQAVSALLGESPS